MPVYGCGCLWIPLTVSKTINPFCDERASQLFTIRRENYFRLFFTLLKKKIGFQRAIRVMVSVRWFGLGNKCGVGHKRTPPPPDDPPQKLGPSGGEWHRLVADRILMCSCVQ